MKCGPYYCVCGKICTSKAGIILHHKICKEAKLAIKNNKSPCKTVDIITTIDYTNDAKLLINKVNDIAYDISLAFRDKNKSAARRARNGLLALRKEILPIRKSLLKVIK